MRAPLASPGEHGVILGMQRDAEIAFVICYPFQYHVLKDVYALLKDRAEFVIDLGAYFPARQSRELEADLIAILTQAGVRYRILRYEEYFHDTVLKRFFAPYKGIVALWERGCVKLACNASKPKIQLTYGAGKELNMVRVSRGIFDCILSYGERDHALASYYTKSVIVGNPRFDPWFRGEITRADVADIANRLDPAKKTLLYLPTHSDLSSVDALADELQKLTSEWNVIAKMHYFTPREESARVARMRASGAIVCGDDVDLVRLLSVPDVVLSDNSSAIFDAILADKPVLATDFLDVDYLDETHKNPRTYRRGAQPALTYSGSIEQTIKKEKRVPTIASPESLRAGLEEALRDDERYRGERAKLRRELFAFNDGACAARAARVIEEMLEKPVSRERPILFHAIEAYRRSINHMSYTRAQRLKHKVQEYQRAVQENAAIDFSPVCILFRDDSVASSIEIEAIRAACEQELPYAEIIVLSVGKKRELALPEHLQERIRDVRCDSNLFASTLDECLTRVQGTHVFFGTTACMQPSGWTLRHKAAYVRHGNLGGVGGYVQPFETVAKGSSHLLSQFYAARALHISHARYLPKLYETVNQVYAANPAGDLRAMSYALHAISPIPGNIRSILQLEEVLKISTLKIAPLCFLPTPLRTHTVEAFNVNSEIDRGEIVAAWRHTLAEVGGASVGVGALIGELLDAARMHRSIAFALSVGRWRGAQILGYFRFWLQYLRRIGEAHIR